MAGWGFSELKTEANEIIDYLYDVQIIPRMSM